MGFSRHGEIYRDEQGIASMPVAERAGALHTTTGPPLYRSEFPPAIPRRVAPQQSPLPLRRIIAYTCSHEAGATPRSAQPVSNFGVSAMGCSPEEFRLKLMTAASHKVPESH